MTNTKPTVDLDQVLDLYSRASESFDAEVLRDFIAKYPEHAKPLQRFAQVQLTFKQPSRDEVEQEKLTDEEMLPRRSKLLQRMQQGRDEPSSTDVTSAGDKLAKISGASGVNSAAQAIFLSTEHGEDLLFLSIVDSTSEVNHLPHWFNAELGKYLDCPPAAVVQAMAIKRQRHLGLQRFSAQDKLAEGPPPTWEQLVEDCITDENVKRNILERTERS